jgi:hypothetical protein
MAGIYRGETAGPPPTIRAYLRLILQSAASLPAPCFGHRAALQGKISFAGWLREKLKEFRNKPMGLYDLIGRSAAAPMAASGMDSGNAARRQRLAEALRANLARRKAQKRDHANKAESRPVGDETPQHEPAPSEEGKAVR